ncbi:MAG: DNA alkylation repair protein [Alphaproteobacteria bacterium]|nr:DNA alkylation repair protein [Alphaproteobacteria bacterium]
MKPITPEHRDALNKGIVESKNLMETLAIDLHMLLKHIRPTIMLPPIPETFKITKKMAFVAQHIYEQEGITFLKAMGGHTSDMVRSLCCYIIGRHSVSLNEKLSLMKPFSDDPNSGVREWAWMALRSDIIEHLDDALVFLQPWTLHESERIRRFACEAIRPRGVWCAHIRILRNEPWKALSLIENLKADSARYVQLSVGNWLNDAGKDHPKWVTDVCDRWQRESPGVATEKICKRGMRRLSKV